MNRLPVVFAGHGDPRNALRDNAWSRALARLGAEIGRPRAVVCVSAHWTTDGLRATSEAAPRTIHDFSGFPPELYAFRYPAPGSPETAALVRGALGGEAALDDGGWGLDHGAWSVLAHLYPRADVPVVELSVDPARSGGFHLDVGRRLAPLRERGILILGSGNVVHNLARLDWSPRAAPEPWCAEFDAHVKARTEAGDADSLAGDPAAMPGGALSVPTPEHWLPYLCVLGAAAGDAVAWEHEGLEHGSLSMRTASFGLR
ncbi:MAG: 4,5-DOPA dioxygenase extradiol [Elusimicrobia bacterium]|nr:4,5-DOPA dioxygenase extradiol [Elusimicrobiota bacterium]